jgi:hypothetical protein
VPVRQHANTVTQQQLDNEQQRIIVTSSSAISKLSNKPYMYFFNASGSINLLPVANAFKRRKLCSYRLLKVGLLVPIRVHG